MVSTMALRFDTGSVSKVQRTPQGVLRMDAGLTRSGVFVYFEGRREVREYHVNLYFNTATIGTFTSYSIADTAGAVLASG
jgi:hypothetical protein